jgi:hypothetical protein
VPDAARAPQPVQVSAKSLMARVVGGSSRCRANVAEDRSGRVEGTFEVVGLSSAE